MRLLNILFVKVAHSSYNLISGHRLSFLLYNASYAEKGGSIDIASI